MFEFLKGKPEKEDVEEVKKDDVKTEDHVIHAMGEDDSVPQVVKDACDKIRGEVEPDFVEVEVDDEGNAIDPEQAELLKSSSEVKDDDASGGDAVNQGDKPEEKPESEDVDGSGGSDDVDLEDIDPRLLAAGKAMKWSDDKVRLVAATDVTILEDIATRLELSETHRQDNKEEKEVKDDTGQADNEALTKLKEKLGDDADGLIDALTKSIESKFEGRFKEVDDLKASNIKEAETKAAIQRGSIADYVFDQAAEHFDEFGITKELPKKEDGTVIMNSPQVNLRNKVYQVATIFHQANGGTFEQAMVEAVQHYAGGQGVQVAARQVVKDLKDNQKRFTPKPTRRKTVKVFKNENAKAAHIVSEAKRKAGIE